LQANDFDLTGVGDLLGGRFTDEHLRTMIEQALERDNEVDWFTYAVERMAGFSRSERESIIHYLEYRAARDESSAADIHQALERYWRPSAYDS
jgi:hypothetical protein